MEHSGTPPVWSPVVNYSEEQIFGEYLPSAHLGIPAEARTFNSVEVGIS